MNVIDYVIIAVIVIAFAAAMVKLILDKKHGKGCCGSCCDCDKCSEKQRKVK